MPEYSDTEKLEIFKRLFQGREDVFALRWEKGKKSGYMPAYHYDPYIFQLYKIKGGTLKDFKDKKLAPLTDQEILNHLHGRKMIGMYPLLKENTSWFIVADFDKENWATDCRKFITLCKDKGIPAYLERSRSGKGGHVWIFFDKPYPAIKSRRVMTDLLEQTGIVSIFDKSTSFDRLFPNQDVHSGKGMGNLIALPLNKQALDQGNCSFVNDNLVPFQDQWKFLRTVQKVTKPQFDEIYKALESGKSPVASTESNNLHIRLSNVVHLNKSAISIELVNFLKEELNISNSVFYVKKNSGRSTWGIERNFKLIDETKSSVKIPRGFIGKLIRFCKKQNIEYELKDERSKLSSVSFETNFNLRPHQESAIEAASHKDFGVITSPPGSGKTVIGLQIIADKKQPALIIVHRKQLMQQWIEGIQAFLGIPRFEIGRIGQGSAKPGKAVTVAMIQSLSKYLDEKEMNDLARSFGTLIIDECHHIPAKSYRNTIQRFSSYYQYGLTATPFRKGSDGKMIFTYLGEIIADIKEQEIESFKKARVVVRNTDLDVPFNSKTDPFEILSRILIHDSNRNKLILSDIIDELNKGRKAVVITERKDHIASLHQFLKQSFEVITLSGDDSENIRKSKWKVLKDGSYQVCITTGQLFGEGSDLQNASCLFLVYPFSFKGKLIQYIGRVQRSELHPIIYDYRDRKVDYLNRLFLKRNRYYRNFDRQATLFEDIESEEVPGQKPFVVDKVLKIPIEQLDFRYGAVVFKYSVPKMKQKLEFEIENDDLRPEFDVLKPYFAKVLKSNKIEIQIYTEFEDDQLVAQNAVSPDIDKIKREIIDSVKFRYIEQGIIGKKTTYETQDNLLDINQVQEGDEGKILYNSGEQLLNEVLKNEKVKHYRQLRYLASKHDATTLKLRFVLHPFSFVFLLPGMEQYHIVLETLDTEEATYIWHTEKNKTTLKNKLRSIDADLNIIRNKGRQAFLDTQPLNFSKILHDYTEDRKGFVVWKDLLEERLV